jgi:PIN domain nuclease of toxin-antitoxin system
VKVLLDTHAFLWWASDDSRLSSRASKVLADTSNETFFSAASGWEIAIKTAIGRLKISPEDPAAFVMEQVTPNGFGSCPYTLPTR